jgi:MYXO-CTERM domain-containing protein
MSLKTFCTTTAGQLAIGLLIVAAVFVAFAVGGEPGQGAISAAIVLAFLLLVLLGRRRSDTLDVMSGIGDERGKLLYTRAVAFSGTVMSFVLPGWWLVTVASGEPNNDLALMCAIFGATFVGAVLVLARRS